MTRVTIKQLQDLAGQIDAALGGGRARIDVVWKRFYVDGEQVSPTGATPNQLYGWMDAYLRGVRANRTTAVRRS